MAGLVQLIGHEVMGRGLRNEESRRWVWHGIWRRKWAWRDSEVEDYFEMGLGS